MELVNCFRFPEMITPAMVTCLMRGLHGYCGGTELLAIHSYVAYSPLVSQITFKSNSTVRMTTTKQYDLLNRLSAIANQPSADSSVSFNYAYNSANQRTRMVLAD